MFTLRRIVAATAATAIAALAVTTAPVAARADGAGHQPRCKPSVRALPDLGHTSSSWGFNRHGVVVGRVNNSAGQEQASYWDRHGLHIIPTGYAESIARDINDRGVIMGNAYDEVAGHGVAWVWDHGRLHRLRGLGAETWATSINEQGTVVGYAFEPDGPSRAVRWRSWSSAPEVLPMLGGIGGNGADGINDRGQVVGREIPGTFDAQFPVTWDRRGRLSRLPVDPAQDLVNGWPRAINEHGQATGGLTAPDPEVPYMAVRWTRNGVTKIGNLPGDHETSGLGIAENGWVVGLSNRYGPDGLESRHAFFWDGRRPIMALPTLARDWASAQSVAGDVDSAGTVAGWSHDDSGTQRATVWTCAHKLAFVPPALPASSARVAVPPKKSAVPYDDELRVR